MLNMQNVKDIEITEGNVRTIHDKDSRLIWGRLAYDTKYAGDTYQQTYSGANLFNLVDTNGVGTVTTVSEDGFITQSKDNSSGTTSVFNNYFTHNLALNTSTTYTIVIEVQAISGAGSLIPVGNHATSQSTIQLEYSFSDLHAGDIIVKQFNTKSSFSGDSGLRGYTRYGAGESGSITYRISVLADTSITPATFVYQPFTGNIPAPNPDYPQPIQVVTGEQTVTISDGVDSEDFTISLGTIELCKIGDYQDYIYQNNGDWYVHKAVGKVVLDGSNDETWNTSSLCYYITLADKTKSPYGVCDHFIYSPDGFSTSNTAYRGCCTGNKTDTGLYFMPLDASQSSVALFKTWLSTNQTTAYYHLATATDTKITDSTLLGQLNAVHDWLTRYGYTSTVTGNLPIIIDKTNL